jgi:hypothetical protein
MSILGQKQAEINALIAEENKSIEVFNGSTDKDFKKQVSDTISEQEKKVKDAQDEYKNLQDKIKKYDSLRDDMEKLVDDIEEQTQKQVEININKFRMEVEIRLKMGEAERDWNKFRKEVLEHADVLKGTEFDSILGGITQNTRDVLSYFDVGGSRGSLETLTEQLMATRAEIESINKTGTSAIYGDNKAKAMEDLQEDLK